MNATEKMVTFNGNEELKDFPRDHLEEPECPYNTIFDVRTKEAVVVWVGGILGNSVLGADVSLVISKFAHWMLTSPEIGLSAALTATDRDNAAKIAALYQREIDGGATWREEWQAIQRTTRSTLHNVGTRMGESAANGTANAMCAFAHREIPWPACHYAIWGIAAHAAEAVIGSATGYARARAAWSAIESATGYVRARVDWCATGYPNGVIDVASDDYMAGHNAWYKSWNPVAYAAEAAIKETLRRLTADKLVAMMEECPGASE